MSKPLTITVRDEKVPQVEKIREHLESHNISFSAFTTDAIIEQFEKGLFGKLIKKVEE